MMMLNDLRGLVSVAGRVLLSAIFLLSAVGNKIPNSQAIAGYMGSEGVPAPQFLLAGAIAFLIAGSASLVLGFKPRVGAGLLTVFLVLATYYFHDFWNIPAENAQQVQEQMIQFMKNSALIGAMLLIMANGVGGWTLDAVLARQKAA